MNCKPDSLAVIVHTPEKAEQALGVIVHVREVIVFDGTPCWTYDHMPLRGAFQYGSWEWHELPDEWLRPIRDPGDDAADESLAWLPPVPKPEILALPVREMGERYA